MKNLLRLSLITFAFLAIYSCKKDVNAEVENLNLDHSYVSKMPVEDQVAYANKHLKQLGLVFNRLWKQKNFRMAITERLDKRVDGNFDTEFLFKDLSELLESSRNIKYSEKDIEIIKKELNAFSGILENMPINPQIYIPFYKQHKNRLLNIDGKASQPETEYAFSTDPDEPDAVKSYKIENDAYIEQPGLVDEQAAAQKPDFVVLGINEFNPDDHPDYHPIIITDTLTVNNVNAGIAPIVNQNYEYIGDLYIEAMKITKNKENYLKGGPEVHYTVYGLTGDHDHDVDINYYHTPPIVSYERDQEGVEVAGTYNGANGNFYGHWTREQVANGTIKHIHKKLVNDFVKFDGDNSGPTVDWLIPDDYNADNHYESVEVIVFEFDWPVLSSRHYLHYPLNSIIGTSPQNSNFTGDYLRYRTANYDPLYGKYAVFNIPYTGFNEIAPHFYNVNDTDEVIDTPPFRRDGMTYIKHATYINQ